MHELEKCKISVKGFGQAEEEVRAMFASRYP